MKDKKANSIEIPAAEESFEQMRLFFREYLEEEKVSKEGILETMLVMEALFHNLLEQGIGADPFPQKEPGKHHDPDRL